MHAKIQLTVFSSNGADLPSKPGALSSLPLAQMPGGAPHRSGARRKLPASWPPWLPWVESSGDLDRTAIEVPIELRARATFSSRTWSLLLAARLEKESFAAPSLWKTELTILRKLYSENSAVPLMHRYGPRSGVGPAASTRPCPDEHRRCWMRGGQRRTGFGDLV